PLGPVEEGLLGRGVERQRAVDLDGLRHEADHRRRVVDLLRPLERGREVAGEPRRGEQVAVAGGLEQGALAHRVQRRVGPALEQLAGHADDTLRVGVGRLVAVDVLDGDPARREPGAHRRVELDGPERAAGGRVADAPARALAGRVAPADAHGPDTGAARLGVGLVLVEGPGAPTPVAELGAAPEPAAGVGASSCGAQDHGRAALGTLRRVDLSRVCHCSPPPHLASPVLDERWPGATCGAQVMTLLVRPPLDPANDDRSATTRRARKQWLAPRAAPWARTAALPRVVQLAGEGPYAVRPARGWTGHEAGRTWRVGCRSGRSGTRTIPSSASSTRCARRRSRWSPTSGRSRTHVTTSTSTRRRSAPRWPRPGSATPSSARSSGAV